MLTLKLAWGNVRRSTKQYMIYSFILLVSVCIYYLFMSLDAQIEAAEISTIVGKALGDDLHTILSYVGVVVNVILVFLIVYANAFLIKQRSREFGTYLILGLSRWQLAAMLFVESVVLGSLVVVIGLCLGVMFSQIMSIIISSYLGVTLTQFSFAFSSWGAITTSVAFVCIFTASMVFNVFIINSKSLIKLIHSGRSNQRVLRNTVVSALCLLAAVVLIPISYVTLYDAGMRYIDDKFMIATLEVSAGTAFLLFGGISMLAQLLSKSRWIARKLRIITLKNIVSQINSAWVSIAVVCALIFLSMSSLLVGLSLMSGSDQSVRIAMPYDHSVLIMATGENTVLAELDEAEQTIMDRIAPLSDKISEVHTATIYHDSADVRLDGALIASDDHEAHESIGLSVWIMSQEEYNKQGTSLQVSEPTLLLPVGYAYAPIRQLIDLDASHTITVSLAGQQTKIEHVVADAPLGFNDMGSAMPILVLPQIPASAMADARAITMSLADGAQWEIDDLETGKKGAVMAEYTSDIYVRPMTRDVALRDGRVSYFIMAYIVLFISSIMMLATVCILSIQILTQMLGQRRQLQTLFDLGVTRREMNHSMYKQAAVYFMIPFGLAAAHTACVALTLVKTFMSSGYAFKDLMAQSLIDVLLVTGPIYLGIYLLGYLVCCLSTRPIVAARLARHE